MKQRTRDLIIGIAAGMYVLSALGGWYRADQGLMLASRPFLTLLGIIPVLIVAVMSITSLLDIDIPPQLARYAQWRPRWARFAAYIGIAALSWPIGSDLFGNRWTSRFEVLDHVTQWYVLGILGIAVLTIVAMADPRASVTEGADARRWQHSA